MMQHPPPACGGAVHSSSMDQQQHQPQPTTRSVQEEEEEEDRKLWRGELQNWMDKVEEKEDRTLWIENLQHWMDEAYIDYCFSHTGELFTSKVIRNGSKSSDQCYGFIEFKSHAIAERILHKFNDTPMPRVAAAGTKFTLNWASSSSSFGSKEDDSAAAADDDKLPKMVTSSSSSGSKEDDSAAAADDDKLPKMVTTASLLPPETRTPQPTDVSVNSGWEDTLKWWSIIAKETRTPQVVYAAHRVYMIAAFLNNIYGDPPNEKLEELLDELPLHVASIDIVKVFHSIGALSKLVYLPVGTPAKAAIKAINAMVRNNPTSQQLVREAGGRDVFLYNFLSSTDPALVIASLDAISSLFWNEEPGVSAFGLDRGYEYLRFILKDTQNLSALCSQRKALDLIARLVNEHNADYKIVTELEYLEIMMKLVLKSGDSEVQKAALRCLLVLAGAEKVVNSGQVAEIGDTLKEFLQAGMDGINAMDPQDRDQLSEEVQLVSSLWRTCYNESSSLGDLCPPSAAIPTS